VTLAAYGLPLTRPFNYSALCEFASSIDR
jgi:hypothetical protein